jgi:hypothetical protein
MKMISLSNEADKAQNSIVSSEGARDTLTATKKMRKFTFTTEKGKECFFVIILLLVLLCVNGCETRQK